MKKLLFILAVAILAAPSTIFAQKTTVTRINREKSYKTSSHNVSVWYQGEVNLGFATGGKLKWKDGSTATKTNFSRAFLETVHGVRITKYGFVGLGAGVQYAFGKMNPDYSESKNWNAVMIPVFVNLKGYYPINDDFAPYISISLGSSICASSNYDSSDKYSDEKLKGGMYADYGIGINYKKLNFGLGLLHQGLKFESSYRDEVETEKAAISSFYVKVGLKF